MANQKVYLLASLKLHRSGPVRKGVTLMELMVVIAIIAIMVAATAVYLGGAKNDKAVQTAAREVASAVREAQNYALTGKNASSDCTTYEFNWTDNSADYSIKFAEPCTAPAIDYTLKNGVTFDVFGTISFSIPQATLDADKSIKLKKSGATDYYVCVCSSGKITESATNCPAC